MTTPHENGCQCSGVGYCPVFQRPMKGRAYQVCSGQGTPEKPVTPEQTAKYRALWIQQGPVPQPTAADLAIRAAEAHARWLAAGGKLATEEQQAQRRAACDACEWHEVATDRCKHPQCGCYLAGVLLNKIRMATEQCPLGRWTAAAAATPATDQP